MESRCHNCLQNEAEMKKLNRLFGDFNNNAPRCTDCILANTSCMSRKVSGSQESVEMINNNRVTEVKDAQTPSPKNKNILKKKLSDLRDRFCESKKVDRVHVVRWADEIRGAHLVTVCVIRPRLAFAEQLCSSPIIPRSILKRKC